MLIGVADDQPRWGESKNRYVSAQLITIKRCFVMHQV
jgi:hypothetical protein